MGIDKSMTATGIAVAEKYHGDGSIIKLRAREITARFIAKETLNVLASHRHSGTETHRLLEAITRQWPAGLQSSTFGSSLKFCKLAQGEADFYPRLAPTYEWDTAAAQAVLVAAGGCIIDAQTLLPLHYNTKNSLLNPWFFALGDSAEAWSKLIDLQVALVQK